MIEKKLNQIRDKIHIKSVSDDDLFLTKGETKYLLRLIGLAETRIMELEEENNKWATHEMTS